jgi:hypothetical protein
MMPAETLKSSFSGDGFNAGTAFDEIAAMSKGRRW